MKLLLLILFCSPCVLFAQLPANLPVYSELPVYDKSKVTVYQDWLVDKVDAKAQLYKTKDGKLVFSNGLVSRTFMIKPNCATVSLDLLSKDESFLRSVRPEAEVTLAGLTIPVGGLTGQPIHNYLLPEWIDAMKTDPVSFQFSTYRVEEIKERFSWKKRPEWMPKDIPWPAPGKELIFEYRLDYSAIDLIIKQIKNPISLAQAFRRAIAVRNYTMHLKPGNWWHVG